MGERQCWREIEQDRKRRRVGNKREGEKERK